MVRVLIAEDSITCRELFRSILESAPDVTVVGEASNGLEAVALTRKLRPQIVIMDIQMPKMNGFEATKQIMRENPTPILIVSASLDVKDVKISMSALSAGALRALEKPPGPGADDFEAASRAFVNLVVALADVKVVRRRRRTPPVGLAIATRKRPPRPRGDAKLVVIGASTGGPPALELLLKQLPASFPAPILIVQHMAPGFTAGLSEWLDGCTQLRVKIGSPYERLVTGTVYMPADDRHLVISDDQTIGTGIGAPIAGFCPSVTALFQSAAEQYGNSVVAVILTGMGRDGAEGLLAVRKAGGTVVAQDEDTSVVFGMPKAAIDRGLVDVVLPIDAIAGHLMAACRVALEKAI